MLVNIIQPIVTPIETSHRAVFFLLSKTHLQAWEDSII